MKLVFMTMLLASASSFAGITLEDKVCRGGNTISPDCTLASRCETRTVLNLRENGSVNWNAVCSRLYDRYNMIDPIADKLEE